MRPTSHTPTSPFSNPAASKPYGLSLWAKPHPRRLNRPLAFTEEATVGDKFMVSSADAFKCHSSNTLSLLKLSSSAPATVPVAITGPLTSAFDGAHANAAVRGKYAFILFQVAKRSATAPSNVKSVRADVAAWRLFS